MIKQSQRLQRLLDGKHNDRPPVWMMRQAGRYLPEYQKVRSQAGDFLTLCKTPELACEVTLQPLRRFPLDAAILFSDILTIPDAMNLGLVFNEHGPVFTQPIRSQQDIEKLPTSILDNTRYVADTLDLLTHALDKTLPIFGFSGSPWTLATYMIEGKMSKQAHVVKAFRYQNPSAMHQLLHLLTEAVIEYIQMQINHGADTIMLFDTWGSLLTEPDYKTFSLPYLQRVCEAITDRPLLVFTKGYRAHLLAQLPCQGISVDWTTPLAHYQKNTRQDLIIQGNFDPTCLLGSPEHFPHLIEQTLDQTDSSRLILNLGHGILPQTPPEHVLHWLHALFDYYQD